MIKQLTVVLAFLIHVRGDILFPKDISVDFEFPPKVRRSSSGIPDGHLRPLGMELCSKPDLPRAPLSTELK